MRKKVLWLIIGLMVVSSFGFSQKKQSSEKEKENAKLALHRCFVYFDNQEAAISIQDALDIAVKYVKDNKLDFPVFDKNIDIRMDINNNNGEIILVFTFIHNVKDRIMFLKMDKSKKIFKHELGIVDY